METTRLSSKGQVIIPKSVRDAKGWNEGIEFVVEERPDGVLLKPKVAKPFLPTSIEDVFGILKYEGPPVTIEDMETAIDAERAERWKRKNRR